MEQKVELLETLKHKIHEEKQEIEQDLSDRIVALEQDVARRNKIIANQKKRIDGLANSEALEQKNEILSQKHNQLCDSIEVMLYCKETNDPMKTPCFTTSGNTVDKEVMEMWIQDGQKDPWNGKPCIEVTKNLLAEDLGILLEQYKAKSQV
ncbi:unnamed protein product [Moneuplotes crassus]|uniref:U-box domain-containing protein n=1 Tax=Euplotes crassus TaxID=5936 RepID=A0AAD2DC12_EUPCR|nr:unnamed protein product [Moneuplotes crassus]